MTRTWTHRTLRGTSSNTSYPWNRIEEFGVEGESLEIAVSWLTRPRRKEGETVYERFHDFWFFDTPPSVCTLGEGNSPLFRAPKALQTYTGLERLYLKNETSNPTGSFKDRGTKTILAMALENHEQYLATVSTGNMGQSVAAYAARFGLDAYIFAPASASLDKLKYSAVYGAHVCLVETDDLASLKHELARIGGQSGLRITSGNHAVRAEGYKFEAFEIWEQLGEMVPDYVAIPTSAGGHIRGIFKGFRELLEAEYIEQLPQMIVIQPQVNAPLVVAIESNLSQPVPFAPCPTLASALTSNDPPGGAEIVEKAQRYDWPTATVSEAEIEESWHVCASAGLWLEPSASLVFPALRSLRRQRRLKEDDLVVAVLTGSGTKDLKMLQKVNCQPETLALADLEDFCREKLNLR